MISAPKPAAQSPAVVSESLLALLIASRNVQKLSPLFLLPQLVSTAIVLSACAAVVINALPANAVSNATSVKILLVNLKCDFKIYISPSAGEICERQFPRRCSKKYPYQFDYILC